MDGSKDAGEQSAADSRLGRLERDGSGVADDPRSDPDEAGRRPVGHLLRQVGAPQEDTGIAGQCMKLKPHLVPRHALAGKTRPIDRLPACLDMPFGGAALVV